MLDILKPLTSADGSLIHRYELLSNLAKSNHEIHTFVMNNFNYSIPDIKCYHISSTNIFTTFLNYISTLTYVFIFKKYDIISTRNSNFVLFFGLFFKKIKNSHLIYELNGIPEDEHQITRNYSMKNGTEITEINPFTKYISGIFRYILTKYQLTQSKIRCLIFENAMRYSTKIIAVTPGIKEFIHNNYGVNNEKIVVINNGANTDLFRPMNQKESKINLKLQVSKNYVCFVGNFAPWQGVEYLIQAATFVLIECPNARFLIVGDGDMKEDWMKLTHNLGLIDKFIFTGKVPYELINLYINTSDVCVAPFVVARNAKIGLSPLKIYEYLSCGKPVVASNIPGVSDLLQHSGGGIVVTPESPIDIAAAIIQLIRSESLKMQMGSNGREYVMKNHSWASSTKKVLDVYENVIADY